MELQCNKKLKDLQLQLEQLIFHSKERKASNNWNDHRFILTFSLLY